MNNRKISVELADCVAYPVTLDELGDYSTVTGSVRHIQIESGPEVLVIKDLAVADETIGGPLIRLLIGCRALNMKTGEADRELDTAWKHQNLMVCDVGAARP